jgi:hypothetical protein
MSFVDWQSEIQISKLCVERQIESDMCEECTTTSSYENATVGNVVTLKWIQHVDRFQSAVFYWILSMGNSQTETAAGDFIKCRVNGFARYLKLVYQLSLLEPFYVNQQCSHFHANLLMSITVSKLMCNCFEFFNKHVKLLHSYSLSSQHEGRCEVLEYVKRQNKFLEAFINSRLFN